MIFLILAPFVTFTALMLVTSAAVSLFAGAAVATVTVAYDVYRGRSIKMLGAGAAVLFGALGAWIALIDGNWSATEVRLAVDIGTLSIALFSIAIRQPWFFSRVTNPRTSSMFWIAAVSVISTIKR